MSLQQQQLNRQTAQQQNTPMRKTATSMMQPSSITRAQDFQFDTGSFATSTAVTPIQPSGDAELSDILNSVIDQLPDYQENDNILSGILPQTTSLSQPSQQPHNQEQMAINAITKSLMQIESTGVFNSSPPAYSMHNVNTQSQVNTIALFFRF